MHSTVVGHSLATQFTVCTLNISCVVQVAMFRFPLQTVRSGFKRAWSIPVRTLTESSTSNSNKSVSQSNNERQVAQATANKVEILDNLCTRLVDARQTTRIEQLIWLAKHSLEESATRKNNATQVDVLTPEDDMARSPQKQSPENQTVRTTEVPRRQSEEALSIWPHLWY